MCSVARAICSGLLDPQRIQILKESLLEARRVFADGDAGRGGVADDLVVHVGNVHDVADLGSGQQQKAAQHVDCRKVRKLPMWP